MCDDRRDVETGKLIWVGVEVFWMIVVFRRCKFYGEGDLRPDGSSLTAEWITAARIPILSRKSFRLARAQGNVEAVVFHAQSYEVFETLPICWPQFGASMLLCSARRGGSQLAVGFYQARHPRRFEGPLFHVLVRCRDVDPIWGSPVVPTGGLSRSTQQPLGVADELIEEANGQSKLTGPCRARRFLRRLP